MLPTTVSFEQETDIISACLVHEDLYRSMRIYRCCILVQGFFLKFDGYDSLYPQYKTQEYLFELASTDSGAPHIPKVYHFFISTNPPMDGVPGHGGDHAYGHSRPEPPSNGCAGSRVATWFPAPSGLTIGCLGSGIARHALFKNCEAPFAFSSIEALEI